MLVRGILLVLSAALFTLAGCKAQRPESAQAKSLDNLAGGNVTNVCIGTHQVKAAENQLVTSSDAVRAELVKALTALPEGMQAAFFTDMKGKIVVGSANECAQNATACWKPAGDDAIEFYVKAGATEAETIANVQHATVQQFGYWLAQVLLKIGKNDKGTDIAGNEGLFQFEGDLAVAMLDTVARNEKLSLAAFKDDLPGDILSETMPREERAAKWSAIATTPGGRRFAEAVFVEAFDSWYCSKDSQENMAALFKRAKPTDAPGPYDLMKSFSATLETVVAARGHEKAALQTSPTADDPTQGEGETSLRLWGRWGPGNGPIRQAVSNYAEWRAEGNGLLNFRRFADGGGLIFRENWFNPFRWGDANPYSTIQNPTYASSGQVVSADSAYGYPSTGVVSGYSYGDPGYTYYDNSAQYTYYVSQ